MLVLYLPHRLFPQAVAYSVVIVALVAATNATDIDAVAVVMAWLEELTKLITGEEQESLLVLEQAANTGLYYLSLSLNTETFCVLKNHRSNKL